MYISPIYYTLDENRRLVECLDSVVWALWMETANRVVRQDRIGTLLVSTVFVGVDHRVIDGDGPPIVFETMVFDGVYGGDFPVTRCST